MFINSMGDIAWFIWGHMEIYPKIKILDKIKEIIKNKYEIE